VSCGREQRRHNITPKREGEYLRPETKRGSQRWVGRQSTDRLAELRKSSGVDYGTTGGGITRERKKKKSTNTPFEHQKPWRKKEEKPDRLLRCRQNTPRKGGSEITNKRKLVRGPKSDRQKRH